MRLLMGKPSRLDLRSPPTTIASGPEAAAYQPRIEIGLAVTDCPSKFAVGGTFAGDSKSLQSGLAETDVCGGFARLIDFQCHLLLLGDVGLMLGWRAKTIVSFSTVPMLDYGAILKIASVLDGFDGLVLKIRQDISLRRSRPSCQIRPVDHDHFSGDCMLGGVIG